MWTVEDNMFLIPGVTREMLNMKVDCTVTNSEGSGMATTIVDVSCKSVRSTGSFLLKVKQKWAMKSTKYYFLMVVLDLK